MLNPRSETGNPPEGWESEGQIQNPKFDEHSISVLKERHKYEFE
jgi:hypothetical protein